MEASEKSQIGYNVRPGTPSQWLFCILVWKNLQKNKKADVFSAEEKWRHKKRFKDFIKAQISTLYGYALFKTS